MSIPSLQCCVMFLLVGHGLVNLGGATAYVPTVTVSQDLPDEYQRYQLRQQSDRPDVQGAMPRLRYA
ncbi:unnamed protein product [Dicrocoelium dendriticum]|nr:unnamed protein product [Dicrocoelium dendriticum]